MPILRSTVLIALLAGWVHAAPVPIGEGVLALDPPSSSANKLSITISAVANGITASDTQSTSVTGALNVRLGADPDTGATSEFTIHNSNVALSDMAFKLKALLFIEVAKINTSGVKGLVFTPSPPGTAVSNATGGTFDASRHSLRINQGAIKGSAFDQDFSANFSESPVEGSGTGTGSITVAPGGYSATHRNCEVVVTLPVDFSTVQDLEGNDVTIKVKGTIRAAGTVGFPLDDWTRWLVAHDLLGASFVQALTPGAAPLGLAWALGHGPEVSAATVTPVMEISGGPVARVVFGPEASRAPVLLEWADSPGGTWTAVPAAVTSLRKNPLPTGSKGEVHVVFPDLPRYFIRASASQP